MLVKGKKLWLFYRFHDAWGFCEQLVSKKSWMDLGKAAMHCLDVDYGEISDIWSYEVNSVMLILFSTEIKING